MKKKKQQIMDKNDIIEIRARRCCAMIIDWYLTNMLAVLPITFYLRTDNTLKPDMFDFTQYDFHTALFLGIFGLIIGFIYYVIIPQFVWKGQTLGKKICKVKVIQENETNVTFKTLFLREIIGQTFLEGGIIITATYMRKMLPIFGLTTFTKPLTYVAYALTIISILYAYFQPQSQSFHDKIAKTIVVKK